MKGKIYKITSPSDRIYIGCTTNLKQRYDIYKREKCSTQPLLYNSLKKYGFDKHIFEIIEECDVKDLYNREIYWISFYDCFKNGLNCTAGGQNGFGNGDDNISKRPEVRKKMSNKRYEYYLTNDAPMKGRKHSESSKKLIKEKRANQTTSNRRYVLDLDSGVFYDSIFELSKYLGVKYKAAFHLLRYSSKYKNKYLVC
jgi:group I intron endonuclease